MIMDLIEAEPFMLFMLVKGAPAASRMEDTKKISSAAALDPNKALMSAIENKHFKLRRMPGPSSQQQPPCAQHSAAAADAKGNARRRTGGITKRHQKQAISAAADARPISPGGCALAAGRFCDWRTGNAGGCARGPHERN